MGVFKPEDKEGKVEKQTSFSTLPSWNMGMIKRDEPIE
jgi:hypothetical protein